MATLIDKVKVKAGRLIRVLNTLRKGNAKEDYISIWVEDPNGGNERCLLFTEKELEIAAKRAEKNPEDQTSKSFIRDLLD